mmetsp:Transcript_28519/g.62222  ORF Transcript_28519/g.62222 Transcript_28519/m.62222 type:complete len:206 (-) Transcript_28519:1309-1926(-)
MQDERKAPRDQEKGSRESWKDEKLQCKARVSLVRFLLLAEGSRGLPVHLDALPVRHDVPEGRVGRVCEEKMRHVIVRDHSVVGHLLPLHCLLPVVHPKEDNRKLPRDLACLHQGEDLKELITSPDAARHGYQTHALVGHPELPSEEVVELEGQLWGHIAIHVAGAHAVGAAAKGQGLATGLPSTFVDGLQETLTATCGHVVGGLP